MYSAEQKRTANIIENIVMAGYEIFDSYVEKWEDKRRYQEQQKQCQKVDSETCDGLSRLRVCIQKSKGMAGGHMYAN